MIRLLNSVGKRIFILYYTQFRDYNENEIIHLLIDDGISNFNGARRRVIHATEIFNQNFQEQALRNIANSTRLSIDIRQRAEEILNNQD